MKRVMCLYRVSTKGQVDKTTDDIPMQRRECMNFIEKMEDWEFYDERVEKGISGYKVSADKRDAILDIRALAEKKKFDVLLVFMFDRLGRIENETPFILEWFTEHNIEVWSVNEGQQKIESHSDKLMNYIRFWQASGESEKTSIRVRTRLQQMTSDGVYTGGVVPFGYKLENRGRLNKKGQLMRDLVVDNDLWEHYLTEPYTEAITQIIKEQKPSILLIGATTIGRDLGPRVSARNVTGLTADATKLEISDDEAHEFRMTRPAFGGNLMATILCKNNRPQMSTVRPGVMQKLTPDASRKGEVVDYAINFDEKKISRVKVVKTVKEEKVVTDISQAKILVSGGRGVANKEGFAKLEALAKELGGEVSSSRAMVDAGVMEQSRQVGQTGKTVRPSLYMACGISGAIQHLAGMEESEFIIAINKDKFAPIFSVADLGIVGDLHKIVPMLTERLKNMQK